MNQKTKTLAFLDCFPLKTQISVSRNKTCRELCTQAHLKLPVFCNSISAFLEDGNWSSFYFLPQLSMFLDDTLCIIVKLHKVNPDQDVPPTYVQVPAASRKTLTFYIPNSMVRPTREHKCAFLCTGFESTRNIASKNCNELFCPNAFWKSLRKT